MEKVTQLNSYLTSAGLFSADQLSSWVEDITLKVGAKHEGERVLLHRNTYRAVVLVENYDYATHTLEKFNAYVAVWLAENDDRTELDEPAPRLSIDVLDDEFADIELTLMFEEDIYISRDDSGDISYNGQSWSLTESDHNVAESASVEAFITTSEYD